MPTALLRSEWPPNDGLRPGDERFDAVLASVREHGIRHPLSIKPDWQVIHGAHRLAAARFLGLSTVPVVIWTGAEYVPGEPSDCQSNECEHPALTPATEEPKNG
jgi:hypothetical protein